MPPPLPNPPVAARLSAAAAAAAVAPARGMSEEARRRVRGSALPIDVVAARAVDCNGTRLEEGTPLCIVGADAVRPGWLIVRVVRNGGAVGSIRADDIRPLTASEREQTRGEDAWPGAGVTGGVPAPPPLSPALQQAQAGTPFPARRNGEDAWPGAGVAGGVSTPPPLSPALHQAQAGTPFPARMNDAAPPVSPVPAPLGPYVPDTTYQRAVALERRRVVAIAVAEDRAATLLCSIARGFIARRRVRRVRQVVRSRSLAARVRNERFGESEHAAAASLQAVFRGTNVRGEHQRREDLERAHANARRLEWQHANEQRAAFDAAVPVGDDAYAAEEAARAAGRIRVVVPNVTGALGLSFAVTPDTGVVTLVGVADGVVASAVASGIGNLLPKAGDRLAQVGMRHFTPFERPSAPLVGTIAVSQLQERAAQLGRTVTDVQLVGLAHQIRGAGSDAVSAAEFIRIMASEELRQALGWIGTHPRPFHMIFERTPAYAAQGNASAPRTRQMY